MKQLNVDDLEIHPFNLEIYGEPDAGLAENIDNFGLQTPIKVDPEGRILSGARRWTAIKELGWEEIPAEVPDVDFEDEWAIQLYVLIANAYRKQKTSYQQKKEADAYRRLYDEGVVGKDDLRDQARDAYSPSPGRTGGSPPFERDPGRADKPTALAAQAAGLSPQTYRRYRYITDGGADVDIDKALDRQEIEPDQAESIRSEVHDLSEKLKRDAVGVRTADNKIRDRLREAKIEHSYTADERALRDAEAAATEANKKGKAFLNALHHLDHEGHVDYLDARHALMLSNTVAEIVEIAQELTADGNERELPSEEPTELRAV